MGPRLSLVQRRLGLRNRRVGVARNVAVIEIVVIVYCQSANRTVEKV